MVEGDAEFTAAVYDKAFNILSPDPFSAADNDLSALGALFLDPASIGQLIESYYPDYVMYAPYIIGPAYVSYTYARNGSWDAVNALFQERALTMAGIITRSAVTPRLFPHDELWGILNVDPYAYLVDQSLDTYADDDNMGALMILALLNEALTSSQAAAALGWEGDHLLYAATDPDAMGTLIWAFSFASASDAALFYPLLERHVTRRSGSGTSIYTAIDTTWELDSLCFTKNFTAPGLATSLCRWENEVYWIENADGLKEQIITTLVQSRGQAVAKRRASRPERTKIVQFPLYVKKRIAERGWGVFVPLK